MWDYTYRGYQIDETETGNFVVSGVEFPTCDEALDWIDSELSDDSDDVESPVLHTYLIFYVDNQDDRKYKEIISAYSYEEAKEILMSEYDVYTITDGFLIE